jgi:hypothetical protein
MKKTTAPSSHEGTTGTRAPKLYRQLLHRCTTPVLKTTVHLDPLRRSRFGAAAREDVVTNSPSDGRGKSESKPGQRHCALLAEPPAICSVLANRRRRARLLMSLRVAIERHESPMPMPSCTSHRSQAARCWGGSVLNRSSNGIEREMRYRGQRQ